MKDMQTKKKQSGFSLLEIMMALAIVAVIVVGVIVLYGRVSGSSATTQTVQEITQISQSIKSLYASSGDYSGIDNKTVIDAGAVDQKNYSGTTIRTAIPGYDIEVGFDSANNSRFTLSLKGKVTKTQCIDLSTKFIGVAELVTAEGNTINNVSEATTNCADDATIVLTFA
ncbi:MAG: type 4 pilus major pilin [Francisellaceae bacterium]